MKLDDEVTPGGGSSAGVRSGSNPESASVSGELVTREISNPAIRWSSSKCSPGSSVLAGLRELRSAVVIETAEVG